MIIPPVTIHVTAAPAAKAPKVASHGNDWLRLLISRPLIIRIHAPAQTRRTSPFGFCQVLQEVHVQLAAGAVPWPRSPRFGAYVDVAVAINIADLQFMPPKFLVEDNSLLELA